MLQHCRQWLNSEISCQKVLSMEFCGPQNMRHRWPLWGSSVPVAPLYDRWRCSTPRPPLLPQVQNQSPMPVSEIDGAAISPYPTPPARQHLLEQQPGGNFTDFCDVLEACPVLPRPKDILVTSDSVRWSLGELVWATQESALWVSVQLLQQSRFKPVTWPVSQNPQIGAVLKVWMVRVRADRCCGWYVAPIQPSYR